MRRLSRTTFFLNGPFLMKLIFYKICFSYPDRQKNIINVLYINWKILAYGVTEEGFGWNGPTYINKISFKY